MPALLSVDLGLRTGFAVVGDDGRLIQVRSLHIGSLPQLRRAVPALLAQVPDLTHAVLEGGGAIADVWLRELQRRGVESRMVSAETWRKRLLLPRDQRNGDDAKRNAEILARRLIGWSDLAQPKALRHDAAEAVLVALWALLELHWPVTPPADLPADLRGAAEGRGPSFPYSGQQWPSQGNP